MATAYADSSPMMVLTGQVATAAIGNNAFQEADIFSLMMPITKHNYVITSYSIHYTKLYDTKEQNKTLKIFLKFQEKIGFGPGMEHG